MKNQLNNLFTAFMTIAFAFVIGLSSTQETSAQRYLSEIKDSNDVKGIAQFADNLANFLELAEKAEAGGKIDSITIKITEAAGKKIKDGTSNFRSNLKALVANLKSKNQWNEDLDNQFLELLGSRKIKGFFQRNTGRKILTDADTGINSIAADVDAIIANLKNKQASNSSSDSIFTRTAFAPTASARKLKFKCVVLGAAIFGAELVKAPKTAENLDGFFDKSCGAGANTAT